MGTDGRVREPGVTPPRVGVMSGPCSNLVAMTPETGPDQADHASDVNDTTTERFTISASTYRTITIVAFVLILLVVISGASVRLTGSGMGCETWPNCSQGEFIGFTDTNKSIEQANRLFSGIAGIGVAVVALVGALRLRPYRRDLMWWSVGMLVGVAGQIPLGGITVLTHLHPAAVGSHFVLSMVLMAIATVLLWRARHEAGPTRPRVSPEDVNLSRLAVFTACALMITGPIVTGSGPHAGDQAARRFDFFIPDVVRIHSVNMWIFLIVTVVLLFRLARTGTPADIMRRGSRLLLAIVVQGAIGYTQYELGIPAWLVILHVAGATVLLSLMVWFHLGLSVSVAEASVVEAPAADDLDPHDADARVPTP